MAMTPTTIAFAFTFPCCSQLWSLGEHQEPFHTEATSRTASVSATHASKNLGSCNSYLHCCFYIVLLDDIQLLLFPPRQRLKLHSSTHCTLLAREAAWPTAVLPLLLEACAGCERQQLQCRQGGSVTHTTNASYSGQPDDHSSSTKCDSGCSSRPWG